MYSRENILPKKFHTFIVYFKRVPKRTETKKEPVIYCIGVECAFVNALIVGAMCCFLTLIYICRKGKNMKVVIKVLYEKNTHNFSNRDELNNKKVLL